jgi:hypothetical protein
MQLLFKSVEVGDGLVRASTLTQKILELIHGVGITGQEVTARVTSVKHSQNRRATKLRYAL